MQIQKCRKYRFQDFPCHDFRSMNDLVLVNEHETTYLYLQSQRSKVPLSATVEVTFIKLKHNHVQTHASLHNQVKFIRINKKIKRPFKVQTTCEVLAINVTYTLVSLSYNLTNQGMKTRAIQFTLSLGTSSMLGTGLWFGYELLSLKDSHLVEDKDT